MLVYLLHSNADTKNYLNAWIPCNAPLSRIIVLESTNYQYIRSIRSDLETAVLKGRFAVASGLTLQSAKDSQLPKSWEHFSIVFV